MSPEELAEAKGERARLKEFLFAWRYGGIKEELWPADIKKMAQRFEELTQKLILERSPTGRSPSEPELQYIHKEPSKEAREIIEAFKKSHPLVVQHLDIDYSKLELLVLADLDEKDRNAIYGREAEEGSKD